MSYTVKAKRWRNGWELHIEGEGVTQARSLLAAEQAVRDYLATLHDVDEVTDEITVVPDVDEQTKARISRLKRRQTKVDEQVRAVAAEARQVVGDLRRSGLSVSDVAVLLNISRGRVSQLDTAARA